MSSSKLKCGRCGLPGGGSRVPSSGIECCGGNGEWQGRHCSGRGDGAQGSGLVRAILADPDGGFTARALTRDENSERAREFAELGAEVVEADLDDEASLRTAFDGAHGVYVVTNFWEPRTSAQEESRSASERELAQAHNAAQAARAAGVNHAIWSTLADSRPYFEGTDAPIFEGKYRVPHADGKAEANRFFLDAGVPTTFQQANVYYEAFLNTFIPRRDENGNLVLALGFGEARVPSQAQIDIGRTAYGIFRKGESMTGATVSVAGAVLTGAQYARALGAVLEEPVSYQPISADMIRASGSPRAEEVGNMVTYFVAAEQDIVDLIDADLLRELNPAMASFDAWLARHKDDFRRI